MTVRHPAERGQIIDPFVLIPNVQNGDYTLVVADIGKLISKQSGGSGETITLPANSPTGSFDPDAFDVEAFSSIAFDLVAGAAGIQFPVGAMVAIENSGGGTLTIAITTDTLLWTFDNTTGSRTMADGGVAVLLKIADTIWKISGEGLS